MPNPTPPFPLLLFILLFLILPLLFSQNHQHVRLAEAGKRRVHVSDDLDDVVDDEEDDTWKDWGKKSSPSSSDFDPPPDLSKMDMSQIQAEMMKRHSGPAFGFVKLRLGVKRTRDTVAEIAMKWTQALRTGAIGVRFMGVDLSTIMFTMDRGQDTTEVCFPLEKLPLKFRCISVRKYNNKAKGLKSLSSNPVAFGLNY